MTEVYEICVSVGSNADDAYEMVRSALKFLGQFMRGARVSTIYTTPAVNGCGLIYHNAVAIGMVDIPTERVVCLFKEWESENGRNREVADDGRCIVAIDLDVVMVNGVVVREKDFEREYFQRGYRELII